MTGIVRNDLAHSPTTKYKDEPLDNPLRHHSISGHQGPHSSHLQHPGSTSLAQKPKQPESPHQASTNISPGSYGPQTLGNGVLHHQHSYGPQAQEQTYYTPHPSYTTASAPGQYPSSGPQEIMATTQMHRPYPPIYHTPQSSSPASVTSQTHEQHNRSLYTQSPQMTSTLYGYQQALSALNPVQPSPYGAHPSPQQLPLTTQSLMMPHQTSTSQLPHQSSQPPTAALTSPTATTVQQGTPPQRALLNPPHSTSSAPLPSNASHPSPNLGAASSAAPGPIPATTPLVVRQDSNGVQWIAFEYSRDRVKMEYTIRCDVESVNVDTLSQEFKTENCVYPRACCNKDQYRGNRLVYETECNAVGWALADLNPALRGKRGLIQRAVDSWRNSNQDPRLRSRRVRRMAKINRRTGIPQPPPPHMAPTATVASGVSSSSLTPVGPRPPLGPLAAMGPPQLHHHHAQPDGHPGPEEVSGPAEFTSGAHRPLPPAPSPSGQSPTDIRTAQVFHGYPTFPLPANSSSGHRGPSIPPLIRDSGIGSFGRQPAVATSTPGRVEEVDEDDEHDPSKDELFGTLPEGKRRKFILVDDTQRGCRVRVKVMLDQVDMDEIPDSYRMSNSVYPRAYFPVQMKSPRGQSVPGNRYIKDGAEANDVDDDYEETTVGRIMVPAPQVDDDSEISVPRISRRRHRKEVLLNDLGYRMSWSQSRVFAGRMLFLQRSLDAYRNKMRSTMLAAGQEPGSIPSHFETRAGKRRFLDRRKRTASSREGGLSASQHEAEEVEP
ncbi:uncharacterized protein BDV17DRAFT_283770 [Aspergillus undulatus]|uniref:uncharacterized protein n=1 Tax=Aspergillus undulatus TaxID=1810928 RepID=UPI003CCDB6D5